LVASQVTSSKYPLAGPEVVSKRSVEAVKSFVPSMTMVWR